MMTQEQKIIRAKVGLLELVRIAPGMHEATIAGSERIGHNTSGGIEIATSSRIEIIVSGYRHH